MKKIVVSLLIVINLSLHAQKLQDCSECSTRLINVNRDELSQLSASELRILKNEIYARQGFTFSSKELKKHFSKFSWYKPLNINSKIKLNDIETLNVEQINQNLKQKQMAEDERVNCYIENSKYKWISEDEVERIFTPKKRKELGIKYPIWKVYSYSDKSGDYYLVLSENMYEFDQYNKIQAVNIKRNASEWGTTFEMNDFIDPSGNYSNVNFGTRYIYVEDFDQDGKIEPIIVYAATRYGEYEDSWMKILIYRNNIKSRIWIHNSPLDDGRYIEVDKSFYSMPKTIQDAVIRQMEEMQKNKHCYLGHTWKEKIKKGVTTISD